MVVRMRSTRSHTGNRRSHHALKAPVFAVCTNCGANHRPHHMCLSCGFYKGQIVVDLAKKKQERQARINAKKAMRTANQTADSQDTTQEQIPAETDTNKESK